METTEFSEFSYGYALTDNIIHGGLGVSAAPIFPSLKAEGSAGGGYDVKIPLRPVPLFLQFKIPQILVRSSRKMPDDFKPPYYRMPLRTSPKNQHNMLCDLESKGNKVLYATPIFHSEDTLNLLYQRKQIADLSAFFSPLDIGRMNNGRHHVAYDHKHDYGWACSKPRKLEVKHRAEFVKGQLARTVLTAQKQSPKSFLAAVLSGIVEAINKGGKSENNPSKQELYRDKEDNNWEVYADEVSPFRPIEMGKVSVERIAYLSHTYLGCEFFVLGKNA